MGIYRGPGGTGDAVNDAASEALITVQAKDAALAAQAAAEAAQTAAELAETNAETAETNAETAETNAETAATNAASSASAASTSASNAATSATNAANSATAAQTAETNAETAETNAAASASAASTSASNAATSATNASNSASAASTSATNASNSASAAATSATNAANSATAAQTAQTAAELAETNAETAEANAETAEANAAASASAAATSASNASTSASNAATSATNASNSASAAATSATNASNSASAAATSASNAATSESNAASSASAAAASYDSFDDRYLGAKSSAPTLDNDGNTLLVGALYYDTVSSSMKVWSGSAWLDAYASLSGALIASNNLSDLTNTVTARDNLGVEIGVDVQAYDATILKSADIGVSVQGYDADTAKYDDVTANFTGTLQNGGSNVVVDSDIGVTVQAYDAQLADVAGLTPADNNFIVGNGTNFVTESGSTARTSLGLGSIATQDANNVAVTGGSINGTTVGASTPSTGAFTTLSATGDVTIADKIVHSGDTDTAVRFPAADTVTVETGGAERMRITSGGNVGIGTSGPDSVLHVEKSGVSAGLRIGFTGASQNFYDADTQFFRAGNGSERMRIDSSGNVMIGTTTTLNSASGRGSLSINGSTDSILAFGNAGSVSGYLYSYSTGLELTTVGSRNLVFQTSNTERMRIDTSGNVGIGTSSPTAGYKLDVIGATRIQGSVVADAVGGADFRSTNGTVSVRMGIGTYFGTGLATLGVDGANPLTFVTNTAERMRIDSSGNVGIGTSSPNQAITIQRGASADAAITLRGNNNTSSGEVYVGQGSDNRLYIYNRANADFVFGTNNSERMRIDSSGRVLIGATADIGNTPLQIATTGSPLLTCQLSSGSANDYSLGGFLGYDGSNLNGDVIVRRESSTTTGYIAFRTNAGSGVTERARITSGGNFQFNSGYGSVATAYGCRAWVNFNGTGTVAIRASGNVSSITDNGTGDYTINFSTSMPDVNYSITGLARRTSGSGTSPFIKVGGTYSTSAAQVAIFDPNTFSAHDPDIATFAIFR